MPPDTENPICRPSAPRNGDRSFCYSRTNSYTGNHYHGEHNGEASKQAINRGGSELDVHDEHLLLARDIFGTCPRAADSYRDEPKDASGALPLRIECAHHKGLGTWHSCSAERITKTTVAIVTMETFLKMITTAPVYCNIYASRTLAR